MEVKNGFTGNDSKKITKSIKVTILQNIINKELIVFALNNLTQFICTSYQAEI